MNRFERKLVEALADLEHSQWSEWVQQLENLTPEKLAEWKVLAASYYSELSEQQRGPSREQAQKAVEIFKELTSIPAIEVSEEECRQIIDALKNMKSDECILLPTLQDEA